MRNTIWSSPTPFRSTGTLPDEVDVVVVGAGIAGLTTAYQLVRRGARVVLLDDGPIGGGETGRTSAHLASALDDRFVYLEQKFGEEGAKLAAESHAVAIDFMELLIEELEIDAFFQRVDGYRFGGDGTDLDEELAAARRAGLSVEMMARAPLPFDTGPCLKFADQAEIEPMRYLDGIAHAYIERGGLLSTRSRVAMIEPGSPVIVKLEGGVKIACSHAVDATNGGMSSWVKLHLRQAAYRTYVLAFQIERGQIPHALYWDTLDPYHYLRVVSTNDPDREMLLVGGNDHRVGQGDPNAAWIDLEAWSRERMSLGDVVGRWSGQIIEPADGLAHIGRNPDAENVFVITGDSGHGLTHGTIGGLMIPDLIRGVEHRWEKLYAPNRSHMHSFGTLVSEAARSSLPYADWVRLGDHTEIEKLGHDEGTVIRRGLHLVAVYRDPSGACHERSATCPHLRGVVRWNAGEKTWDCPCHGSRFDPYGRAINGPASQDLTVIDSPELGIPVPITEEQTTARTTVH